MECVTCGSWDFEPHYQGNFCFTSHPFSLLPWTVPQQPFNTTAGHHGAPALAKTSPEPKAETTSAQLS